MSDREVLEQLINTLPMLVLGDGEVARFQKSIRNVLAENERLEAKCASQAAAIHRGVFANEELRRERDEALAARLQALRKEPGGY